MLRPSSTLLCRASLVIMILGCAGDTKALDRSLFTWRQLPDFPAPGGVAGAFVGVYNDALIVAGGVSFHQELPEGRTSDNKVRKHFRRAIHILTRSPPNDAGSDPLYDWRTSVTKLEDPIAYGAAVPTEFGLLCIGGKSKKRDVDPSIKEVRSTKSCSNRVFLLQWNGDEVLISDRFGAEHSQFPLLPVALSDMAVASIDESIYVAGGNSAEGPSNRFFRLDLTRSVTDPGNLEVGPWRWEELPTWPGPGRSHAVGVTQHNGETTCFYLIGGRSVLPGQRLEVFQDAYRFNPNQYRRCQQGARTVGEHQAWERLRNIRPGGATLNAFVAGSGIALGAQHVVIFGGADDRPVATLEYDLPKQIERAKNTCDGKLSQQLENQKGELLVTQPDFSQYVLLYHTITDTWVRQSQLEHMFPATATVVRWGADILLPAGEIRPGMYTRKTWLANPVIGSSKFGLTNWAVVGLYVTILLSLGFFCARRTDTTADYFLASGRVPWWAAGISIFATMLSGMTYLGLPSRAFGTNWSRIPLNLGIIVVAPIVIYCYLPFFRQLKVTSAYEYLEARFSLGIRWLGSSSFVLFQIGRMGVVIFLPALALSTVTGVHVTYCILAIGLISTIYTVMGGIEAVIWTDVLQTIVLVFGALAAIWIMSASVNGGLFELVGNSYTLRKLSIAELHWDWTGDAFVVVLIGAIFTNLLPYSSDQSIIQRYMTAPNDVAARRAVWTNAVLAIPATLLFFFVGSALFVFYSRQPGRLGPLAQADSIFPWFIAHEMPAGIAGLTIAGLFAASMSSLDSSMHSIATAVTSDFVKRCYPGWSERRLMIWARGLTLLFGVIGTCSALLLATMDVAYLWDHYLNIIGLLLGTLAGLFALGIFTSHTNSLHAWLGAVASVISLIYVQYGTKLNGLLYGAIALSVCVAVGAITGTIIPMATKDVTRLTVRN